MTQRLPASAGSADRGGASGVVAAAASPLLAVIGAGGLAVLASAGPAAGAVGAASSLVVPLIAAWSVIRRRRQAVTSADRVTLLRVALIGILTSALVLAIAGDLPSRTWIVLGLASAAALLDAVDGWAARRAGRGTDAGARLDAESDAAALLVLSALLAMTVGWWVLLIGLMRYVFAAGSLLRPHWSRALPYSSFRRAVAALQATAVVIGLAPIVPVPAAAALSGAALAALLVSFGRDALLLERMRHGSDSRQPDGADAS
ncbi:CDP-alcohol phosphatidyltransferase family protein [Nesterenkonia populi]